MKIPLSLSFLVCSWWGWMYTPIKMMSDFTPSIPIPYCQVVSAYVPLNLTSIAFHIFPVMVAFGNCILIYDVTSWLVACQAYIEGWFHIATMMDLFGISASCGSDYIFLIWTIRVVSIYDFIFYENYAIWRYEGLCKISGIYDL